MRKKRQQFLCPLNKSFALTLMGMFALPYLLIFSAIGEWYMYGTQHLLDCYREIGIAELLDSYGTNTIGRLIGQ
jgi:hypothetical protein